MLLGRDRERLEIDRAMARARSGDSAILALVGEPGIGKTALLDHAAERAGEMRLLRARGIESEAQIPFASLLELLRPALEALGEIPEPQAVALEGALALRPAMVHERFAVGAATLSLLAACAERQPLAVLIDDGQWLDSSSAQALLFAFRRLVADPIAVLVTIREGEPSLLDGADLPTLRLGGLSAEEAAMLLDGVALPTARRLHEATAGNPLALLELASEAAELAFAPEGAPLLVPARISRMFSRRVDDLEESVRRALVLAAASDRGDLAMLERAAAGLGVDLSSLTRAESAGLVRLRAGAVDFRHPLARSAIYAGASADARRQAHLALAAALPDRDIDRRAWHLAAGAVGVDETASVALEQAAARAWDRSAYTAAAAAFERAARLLGDLERRARLLVRAAEASWRAGLAERAGARLDEARELTIDADTVLDIDELAGHMASRRGPVMQGHAILVAAARRADPERAVAMLAEATAACFHAGRPAEMLRAAEGAWTGLPDSASVRSRFLGAVALGMARVLGGDGAAGADAIHQAVALAESSSDVQHDLQLLPWLAVAPIFLRETGAGRSLLDRALDEARARAAIGALPNVLNLIARDQATTDRLAVAESTYREAVALARECDQRTDLAFGLAGLAWLQARRGRERDCRSLAAEALGRSEELGARLHAIWATAALGELELALGDTAAAARHFEHQSELMDEHGITDVDLSPAPELVEAYIRQGFDERAHRLTTAFSAAAAAKSQPWSLARALRCQGLTAPAATFASRFDAALREHARTPDLFELARTQLAYGERLRRARNRVLAREQLGAAVEIFERLDARPWSERARAEFQATGVKLRRRDPATLDELTPQELQIALQLAGGKTTRETAAALFLSPKTIEYHLRHVYLKLGIHSREELARTLADSDPVVAQLPEQ